MYPGTYTKSTRAQKEKRKEKMSKYYLGSGWSDIEINEKTDNAETNWVQKIKNIFIISRETWIRIIIYASGLLVLIGMCSNTILL